MSSFYRQREILDIKRASCYVQRMYINQDSSENALIRQAAITGLAVVGFIALVGAGMWLAIYSARFVPVAAGRIGAAAVYLGSALSPAHPPAPSTLPAASTTPAASSTSAAPATPAHSVAPTPGARTNSVYKVGGSGPAPALHGLPDLAVQIDAVGYLASTTAESFVVSISVPVLTRPAVVFTVRNDGTNASGPWRFNAVIPTRTAFTFASPLQQSLNPGENIVFTLGFDEALPGANKPISITANFDRAVNESNFNNDSASAKITVLGS